MSGHFAKSFRILLFHVTSETKRFIKRRESGEFNETTENFPKHQNISSNSCIIKNRAIMACYFLLKGTIVAWDFFVLVCCSDQTYKGPKIRQIWFYSWMRWHIRVFCYHSAVTQLRRSLISRQIGQRKVRLHIRLSQRGVRLHPNWGNREGWNLRK